MNYHAQASPGNRIERLQHIVGWFDKWLMECQAGV